MKAKLLCLLLCALPSWTMKAQEEGTARLICRFYTLGPALDGIYYFEGPNAPKAEDITLTTADGTQISPEKEFPGYITYLDIPAGIARLSYSFPDQVFMDATSGVPTEGRPQGGDCGLILSPGNNYLFIRVYNAGILAAGKLAFPASGSESCLCPRT